MAPSYLLIPLRACLQRLAAGCTQLPHNAAVHDKIYCCTLLCSSQYLLLHADRIPEDRIAPRHALQFFFIIPCASIGDIYSSQSLMLHAALPP